MTPLMRHQLTSVSAAQSTTLQTHKYDIISNRLADRQLKKSNYLLFLALLNDSPANEKMNNHSFTTD